MNRRVCLLLLGLLSLASLTATLARRDLLWIALQGCRIAYATVGNPFPCLSINPGAAGLGTAVLTELGNPKHVLVVPTQSIVGIEDLELRGFAGAAYWKAALAERRVVVDAVAGRVSLDDVGMAVNAVGGRSQDQLHIHLACLEPGVRSALRDGGSGIADGWGQLAIPLEDTRFHAMRVGAEDVLNFNPFVALATLPGPQQDLRDTSMAMIAAGEESLFRGFFLLAYRSPDGHAEKLLDHTCGLARTPPFDRPQALGLSAKSIRP